MINFQFYKCILLFTNIYIFNIELQKDMNKHFFGQHIASNIILSALKGNTNRSKNNKKPLVMSFHGWTGCGKNFVVDLIATHIFSTEKVKKLRYHIYNGLSDFFMQAKSDEYRVMILFES